jgi:superfamily II DNA or RNA helicase
LTLADESHRAGASSYQKIMNYFEPKFLLGMTATPERTDDYNICKDFDYNIAYEIRLEQAMEENMLCPFHYFGITELMVDGHEITDQTEFKYLVSNERVRNVIDKINFYGHHGELVKGLVFCSRNEESAELSKAFNELGYRTIALSGSNSQEEREEAIEGLENDDRENHLDYIFTVDICNDYCVTLGHTNNLKQNTSLNFFHFLVCYS